MHHGLTKAAFLILAVLLTAAAGDSARERSSGDAMENKNASYGTAVFAGGCFWCLESDFERLAGVVSAQSGYTGGHKENPGYEEVCEGTTGHREAVRVVYDPARLAFGDLVEYFWRHVDPTDPGGQFADRGFQYTSAIFVANEEERRAAEESRSRLAASGRFSRPIVTEILPSGPFYPAEDHHQDYYKRHAVKYHFYRMNSGRDRFLETVWSSGGRPDKAGLKERLTPLQYAVTQEDATEPPFNNAYWNNKEPGIYVDIVSGEALFSSLDKFDSGTGWPSFTRPLEPENIVTREDRKLFSTRTEVRSRHADSHLGHVFHDGPAPTGLRYCMNSAALRFVPARDLEKQGYGKYRLLFEKK